MNCYTYIFVTDLLSTFVNKQLNKHISMFACIVCMCAYVWVYTAMCVYKYMSEYIFVSVDVRYIYMHVWDI